MHYYIGLDLGQASEFTAWAVIERPEEEEPVYALRHLQRFALGTPFPQIVQEVARLADRLATPEANPTLVVDLTGVGRPVLDIIRRAELKARITPAYITAGNWVFWMDADDRLDEGNRAKLRRLFESLAPETKDGISNETALNAAYVMKCLCLPDRDTGSATVVDHVRLFRNNPRIRWRYRVHEQILPGVRAAGGEARWSDVVINHVGYQDPARLGPKLARDVRLLQMDLADNPEEPFTLFNLGWTLLKVGQLAEAMSHLEKSLALSQPSDSVVRKIYALLVEGHIRYGHVEQALEVCRQGRRVCPDDAEILFQEGSLHLDQGNLAAAEANFLSLLERQPGAYFASVDPGLFGYKSKHSLGNVYHKQGRLLQAERQWKGVLAERPDYTPTLLALGELYLEQGQWTKFDEMIAELERGQNGKVEIAVLVAKAHMARNEFGPAKDLLEKAKQRFPLSLLPRIVLAHALLQENRDLEGAEHALREVLAMDPHHGPTQHNLRILMSKRDARAAS